MRSSQLVTNPRLRDAAASQQDKFLIAQFNSLRILFRDDKYIYIYEISNKTKQAYELHHKALACKIVIYFFFSKLRDIYIIKYFFYLIRTNADIKINKFI